MVLIVRTIVLVKGLEGHDLLRIRIIFIEKFFYYGFTVVASIVVTVIRSHKLIISGSLRIAFEISDEIAFKRSLNLTQFSSQQIINPGDKLRSSPSSIVLLPLLEYFA